jgi:hypothetical protein
MDDSEDRILSKGMVSIASRRHDLTNKQIHWEEHDLAVTYRDSDVLVTCRRVNVTKFSDI